MAEKLPRLPLILTASDLRLGDTVYFDGSGWTRDIAGALLAEDAAAAEALVAALAAARAGNIVVEAFVFTAGRGSDGVPTPVHYRERSRVTGPSFRDDFGRNPPPPGSGRNPAAKDSAHVSL